MSFSLQFLPSANDSTTLVTIMGENLEKKFVALANRLVAWEVKCVLAVENKEENASELAGALEEFLI